MPVVDALADHRELEAGEGATVYQVSSARSRPVARRSGARAQPPTGSRARRGLRRSGCPSLPTPASRGRTARGRRAGHRAWPSPSRGPPAPGRGRPARRSRCPAGSRRARPTPAARAGTSVGQPPRRGRRSRAPRGSATRPAAGPPADLARRGSPPRRPKSARPTSAGSTRCSAARASTNACPRRRRASRVEVPEVVGVAVDDALHELHDVERRSEQAGVAVLEDRARHRHGGRRQRAHHPVLPAHVVGRREHVPQRRPAQHPPAGAVGQRVGQVGSAPRQQRRPQRADVRELTGEHVPHGGEHTVRQLAGRSGGVHLGPPHGRARRPRSDMRAVSAQPRSPALARRPKPTVASDDHTGSGFRWSEPYAATTTGAQPEHTSPSRRPADGARQAAM